MSREEEERRLGMVIAWVMAVDLRAYRWFYRFRLEDLSRVNRGE